MPVRKAAAVTALALLGGCSLSPAYREPAATPVSAYQEAGEWLPARPADAEPRDDWWVRFGDPALNDLQGRLAAANPDLGAAVARFAQARALALGARSDEFPSLAASAAAERQRTSANAPAAKLIGGNAALYNDFAAALGLSWEIDLFGRVRNTAAAARAQAQASAADLAAVRLALQAQLASSYFALQGDDAAIRLLEDTLTTYDRAFELTRNRYREGIAAATDVDQADTQRQNARAQLAAVRRERAQLEHALAVLVGELPSSFTLPAHPLTAAPPPIDYVLPSTLLQRRPDVARAERLMAAANARVGVARAAWFPVFSLSAATGFESTAATTWLAAPSRLWSVGPQGELPLIDFGSRVAVNRQARAAFDEALADYRKTTLTAYQEVEDSLAALHHTADELAADAAAANSAASSARHADERYAAGVADYVEVTTTHTAALQAERAVISARVTELTAAVALVRACGGGWSRGDATLAARAPRSVP